MWKLWNKGGSQPFARVSKRVDEHKLLQDWKITERTPRIIGAPKKDHGGEDHAEHEANVLLIHTAPKRKSSTC